MSQVIARKYILSSAGPRRETRPGTHSQSRFSPRSREQVLAGAYAQHGSAAKTSVIAKALILTVTLRLIPRSVASVKSFNIEQVSFPPQKDVESITAGDRGLQVA